MKTESSLLHRIEARFPIIPADRRYKSEPSPRYIPWSVAEKAYMSYAARFGRDQSLERLAERGGFGVEEMDLFYPNWRRESEDLAKILKIAMEFGKENVELRKELEQLKKELGR